MKKIIIPTLAVMFLFCGATANATSVGLAYARKSLYNSRMSAYSAQIKYYQKASLYYTKKQSSLIASKYGYSKLSVGKKYYTSASTAKYSTSKAMKYAVSAKSVSQLMAALKGW